MVKRWWWVGALVLVAVGLIAYGLVGRNGSEAPLSSAGTQATSTVPAATDSATTAPSTTSNGAVSKPTPPAATSNPAQPNPAPSKAAAVKVAPKGADLVTVTIPPTDTLAQIRYSAARNDQMYDVVIRPYGTGPARAGHGTVVVVIDSSKAQKSYQQPVNLNGVNALLEPGPKIQGAVVVGGTYAGVVRLLRRGNVLVLELVSAKGR